MDVFILRGELDYEPGYILGVYSTMNKAASERIKCEANRDKLEYTCDSFWVQKLTIDEPVKLS